jgi:hypothetical protein
MNMPNEIRRRSDEDAERELRVDRSKERPGGAEGGESSPSVDRAPGAPADDQAPAGDTDQHSDAANLPPHREQANRE